MEIFKIARDHIMKKIGKPNDIPRTISLRPLMIRQQNQEKQQLYIRKSIYTYIKAMSSQGDATSLLNEDIKLFYKPSEEHKTVINNITTALYTQESSILFTYKEGLINDINIEFESQIYELQNLKERISQLDNEYTIITTGGVNKIGNINTQVNSTTNYSNEHELEKEKIDIEKCLYHIYHRRFNCFDNILLRFIECQNEFFSSGLESISNLNTLLKTFCEETSSSSVSLQKSNTNDTDKLQTNSDTLEIDSDFDFMSTNIPIMTNNTTTDASSTYKKKDIDDILGINILDEKSSCNSNHNGSYASASIPIPTKEYRAQQVRYILYYISYYEHII